ncbi:GerAB/ArcD/ProY family transporter [Priestia megaterium]|uniref:GerAB/ArcD/ProY family transporter n=1 Tax=Priestia megaterium TaxID=1404 RepID=UPI0018A259F6|nr:GerAB/ArcD/ProY family transporter [Priestia megaterium]
MIALVIGGFVKINVFFYAVIVGISTLFKVKRLSALTYPVGTVILFFSLTMASNFQEHLKEGLTIMPVLLFIPFHAVIPFTLLCIAFIKHRIKKQKRCSHHDGCSAFVCYPLLYVQLLPLFFYLL